MYIHVISTIYHQSLLPLNALHSFDNNYIDFLCIILEIKISVNQSTYQLQSSSHRITCSSDLTVQSIQWLNTSDNGEILTSNTGEQQLVLELDDITAAINNTNYTCEVTLTLQTTPVVDTIHLVVSDKNLYKIKIIFIIVLNYCRGRFSSLSRVSYNNTHHTNRSNHPVDVN